MIIPIFKVIGYIFFPIFLYYCLKYLKQILNKLIDIEKILKERETKE